MNARLSAEKLVSLLSVLLAAIVASSFLPSAKSGVVFRITGLEIWVRSYHAMIDIAFVRVNDTAAYQGMTPAATVDAKWRRVCSVLVMSKNGSMAGMISSTHRLWFNFVHGDKVLPMGGPSAAKPFCTVDWLTFSEAPAALLASLWLSFRYWRSRRLKINRGFDIAVDKTTLVLQERASTCGSIVGRHDEDR